MPLSAGVKHLLDVRSASWSYFSCCVLSLSPVVAILWVVSTILIGRFGLDGLQFSDVYGLAGDL